MLLTSAKFYADRVDIRTESKDRRQQNLHVMERPKQMWDEATSEWVPYDPAILRITFQRRIGENMSFSAAPFGDHFAVVRFFTKDGDFAAIIFRRDPQ